MQFSLLDLMLGHKREARVRHSFQGFVGNVWVFFQGGRECSSKHFGVARDKILSSYLKYCAQFWLAHLKKGHSETREGAERRDQKETCIFLFLGEKNKMKGKPFGLQRKWLNIHKHPKHMCITALVHDQRMLSQPGGGGNTSICSFILSLSNPWHLLHFLSAYFDGFPFSPRGRKLTMNFIYTLQDSADCVCKPGALQIQFPIRPCSS